MNVKPDILKALRRAKGWTQERLAAEARLNKTAVSRVERGVQIDVRGSTAAKFAKALGVEVPVLTGEAPIEKPSDPFWNRSEINIEITQAAQNALTLTARRYGVTQEQVVELAPFLFGWAAEASLKRRSQALSDLSERLAAVEAMKTQMPHTSSVLGWSPMTDDIVAAEERSILRRDLFSSGMAAQDTGDILKAEFDESEDGPIVSFLRDLAKDAPKALAFETWSPRGAPHYHIGREEVAAAFGDDDEIIDSILNGFVSLSKMPSELRGTGALPQRQEWARGERVAYLERLDEEFRALGIDLDLIVDSKPAEVSR